jgi:DNA-binding Lrp family transcriptional regulator
VSCPGGARAEVEVPFVAAAYILVSVEAGRAKEILATIRALEGVRQAHACWGQPDIFAFLEVPEESTLADVVLERIHNLPGVRSTETHLVVDV